MPENELEEKVDQIVPECGEVAKLDQAFQSLQHFDWGTDPAEVKPIDEAIVATRCDPLARRTLEERLVSVLGDCVSPRRERLRLSQVESDRHGDFGAGPWSHAHLSGACAHGALRA